MLFLFYSLFSNNWHSHKLTGYRVFFVFPTSSHVFFSFLFVLLFFAVLLQFLLSVLLFFVLFLCLQLFFCDFSLLSEFDVMLFNKFNFRNLSLGGENQAYERVYDF